MAEKAKDCLEPICASKKDAMRALFKSAGGSAALSAPKQEDDCPPDREELGRHSWTLVRIPSFLLTLRFLSNLFVLSSSPIQ